MSRPLLFQAYYLRQNVNIPTCFTAERKNILADVVQNRPWANGLNRLLAERRGLKKGQVAEAGKFRPALISGVLNSPKAPDISTLQRIASAITTIDRRGNHAAPAVELWEFFVTDEQAAVLRERAEKARSVQVEPSDDVLMEQFREFLKQRRQASVATDEVPTKRRAR